MRLNITLFTLALSTMIGCGFYQSKLHAEGYASTIPLEPTYTSIRENVFVPKCMDCHKPGEKGDDVLLDTYENTLADPEVVAPGDPDSSDLVKEIRKGKMPPRKRPEYAPVTEEEYQVIRQWIAEGAKR